MQSSNASNSNTDDVPDEEVDNKIIQASLEAIRECLEDLPKSTETFVEGLTRINAGFVEIQRYDTPSTTTAVRKVIDEAKIVQHSMELDAIHFREKLISRTESFVSQVSQAMGLVQVANFERWRANVSKLLAKINIFKKECADIIGLTELLMIDQKINIGKTELLLEKIKVACTPSFKEIVFQTVIPRIPIEKIQQGLNTISQKVLVMGTSEYFIPTLKSMLKMLNAFDTYFRVTKQQYVFILRHEDSAMSAQIYYCLVRDMFPSIDRQCNSFVLTINDLKGILDVLPCLLARRVNPPVHEG